MSKIFDVPSNWYETFFTAPVNRFWESMVPPEATEADLDFIVRHLGVAPPARLLDVPCGAGRHSLGLARVGFSVTGIDLSIEAIKRARDKAKAEKLSARFVQGDMRTFPAGLPFDGAICLGNSLGYFGADGMRAFFGRLAEALRPGGDLILDSYACAESVLPVQLEREMAFEGGSYSARLCYDTRDSVLKTEAELKLDGQTHSLRYAHHVLTSGELVRALAEAGFDTPTLYGDTDDAPYELGSPRLLLTAVRR